MNFVKKLENIVANLGSKFDSTNEIFEVSSSADICEDNLQTQDYPLDLSITFKRLSKTSANVASSNDSLNRRNGCGLDIGKSYSVEQHADNKREMAQLYSVIYRDMTCNETVDSSTEPLLQEKHFESLECQDCSKTFMTFLDLTMHMMECNHYGNLTQSVKHESSPSSMVISNLHKIRNRSKAEDCSEGTTITSKRIKYSGFKEYSANLNKRSNVNIKPMVQNENTDNAPFFTLNEHFKLIPHIPPLIFVPLSNVRLYHGCCSSTSSVNTHHWRGDYNKDSTVCSGNQNLSSSIFIEKYPSSSPLKRLEGMVYGNREVFHSISTDIATMSREIDSKRNIKFS